jgi:hypothetical protein
VLLLALGRSFTTSLGLVFQIKFQQLMLIWLLVAVGMAAAGRGTAPGTFVLALPPLTYFSLFLWQKARHAWLMEVLLLALIAVVVVVRYRTLLRLETVEHIPAEQHYAIQPNPAYAALQGKRLLVLGPDRRPYVQNQLATPYLDWRLSQVDFGHLDEYEAVFRLSQNLASWPPEFIIDDARLMPELKYKVPAVFGPYQATGTPHVYRRQVK